MTKISTVTYAFLLVLIFSLSACNNNSSETDKVNPKNNIENSQGVDPISYIEYFEKAKTDPSSQNVMGGFGALMTEIVASNGDDVKRKGLLLKGLSYAKKYKKANVEANFYTPLLKDYADENSKDYIYKMAEIMKSNGMTGASDVLFSNFANLYPNDSRVTKAKAAISPDFTNIAKFLKDKADIAFKRDKNTKIDKKVVQSYVNACEAYALSDPNNKMAPTYLYKGSELARSIKSFKKVLSLYDWIIDKYPDFDKAPTVQFLKGFILENEIKLDDAAKIEYNKFLKKYPKHELADDVKFLIKNIGKSNDEILKLLGKNNK